MIFEFLPLCALATSSWGSEKPCHKCAGGTNVQELILFSVPVVACVRAPLPWCQAPHPCCSAPWIQTWCVSGSEWWRASTKACWPNTLPLLRRWVLCVCVSERERNVVCTFPKERVMLLLINICHRQMWMDGCYPSVTWMSWRKRWTWTSETGSSLEELWVYLKCSLN